MRTELILKLENAMENFLDEMDGEYYTIAGENRILAKVIIDAVELIDDVYEYAIE